MSLRDEVAAIRADAPPEGRRSKLALILAELPKADADELTDMLADPVVHPIDIYKALRDRHEARTLRESVSISGVQHWCRNARQ